MHASQVLPKRSDTSSLEVGEQPLTKKSKVEQSSAKRQKLSEDYDKQFAEMREKIQYLGTQMESLLQNQAKLEKSIQDGEAVQAELRAKIDQLSTAILASTETPSLALSKLKSCADQLRLQGKLDEAAREFEKALKLIGGEQDLFTVSHYAETLRLQDRLDEAAREFEKALGLSGGEQDLFTVSCHAETLRMQGKFPKAAREFEKALELPGGEYDLFTVSCYAATLRMQGKFAEAARQFSEAASIACKLNKWGEANFCYTKAISAYGDRVPAEVLKEASFVQSKLSQGE